MTLHVLYFALIRERLRLSEEVVELPTGSTALALLNVLSDRHPALAVLRGSLRLAVNEAFVDLDQILHEKDEIALIPPVAGG